MRAQGTMLFLFLPLLLHSSYAFPVFTFNGTSSLGGALSFAYLDKEVELPDHFILCTSVKQARFDGVGFYSVSGRNSQDGWLLMEFEPFPNATKLTIGWDGYNIAYLIH